MVVQQRRWRHSHHKPTDLMESDIANSLELFLCEKKKDISLASNYICIFWNSFAAAHLHKTRTQARLHDNIKKNRKINYGKKKEKNK